ncbi:hypothetical protein [Polymorphospora rubra]|uniref:hypothetical protein n=1 Tax=Polymorphospora rubra TaxID=338584 RepID=UPI0033C1C43B
MTAPDPMGPVVITTRDIYDALIRLTETVQRLVSKGDDHAADLADHEARLRALERGRWPLPAATVLISLAALAVAVLPFIRS